MDEALLAACPKLAAIVFLGTGAASYIDLAAAERPRHPRARLWRLWRPERRRARDRADVRGRAPGSRAWTARSAPATGRRANGIELAGKTLGVIGTGGIGKAMVRLGAGLGMTRDRLEPERRAGGSAVPRRSELDDLLRTADVVSLHLVLNDADPRPARRAPDRADQARRDLHQHRPRRDRRRGGPGRGAARRGRIGHAGLDVFADGAAARGPSADPASTT